MIKRWLPYASRIAECRGLLDPAVLWRITGLLREVGLPVTLADLPVRLDPVETVAALDRIRKIRDDRIRFGLPVELGVTVIADDVTDEEIHAALVVVPEKDPPSYHGRRFPARRLRWRRTVAVHR